MTPASNCQPVTSSYIQLKNAYWSAKIPQPLVLFNIGTILTYFLETRADFKAIRANSFELFTSGHVNVSWNRCTDRKYISSVFKFYRINSLIYTLVRYNAINNIYFTCGQVIVIIYLMFRTPWPKGNRRRHKPEWVGCFFINTIDTSLHSHSFCVFSS